VMVMLAVVVTIAGTSLAARVRERMSDTQFRTSTHRLITGIAGYCLMQGGYLPVAAKAGLSLGF
jgi:hypothetical protein